MFMVCRTTLCLALFCFSTAPTTAATLKIATLAPAGTAWMQEMQNGAREIAARTDGRVEFKFYPGGVMGSEQSVHRKIRVGQLHGGAFSSGGLADIYPDIQSLNIPMLFESFDEVDYVRARLEPQLKKNMEQRGFVLLGIAETGFSRILSQAPIVDLEGVRASKLWAPEGDEMAEEIWLSMGLVPIKLPISDVFTGLQTGLVETVTATPTAAIAFQWHNNTRFVTDLPLAYHVGLLAVQKRAFDRLDPADQAIVREEIATVVARLDARTREDNRKAREALGRLGFEFVRPDPQEIERWQSLARGSVERLVDKGRLTAAIVERVRRHLADFRAARERAATSPASPAPALEDG